MTDPTTEPDEQLVEAVARAIVAPEALDDPFLGRRVAEGAARAAIAAVRAYDAEHDWSVDNDPGLPPAEPRNVKHYRATIRQEQP